MRPTITVASATGTSSAVCDSGSGNRWATANDSATATAPRHSDAVKPMSGSTSRRTEASRIARWRKAGRTIDLTISVPRPRAMMCTERPWCSATGSAARKTPCSAAARIVELSRVVPSTQKSLSTTSRSRRSESSVMALPQQKDHAERGEGGRRHQELRNPVHPKAGHHRLDHADQGGDEAEADQQDRSGAPGIEQAPGHQDADHEHAEQGELDRA